MGLPLLRQIEAQEDPDPTREHLAHMWVVRMADLQVHCTPVKADLAKPAPLWCRSNLMMLRQPPKAIAREQEAREQEKELSGASFSERMGMEVLVRALRIWIRSAGGRRCCLTR